MDNMEIYNASREVPAEALKQIQAGRLKGKSDINPMWRIKHLTEQFGPCGIGWKYIITEKRLEPGANGEIASFVDIDLFVKVDGQWSEAIPGTGGSAFVAKEKAGLYTSDECFKMALTDAIGVACKALGFAANVYWEKDRTKHDRFSESPQYNCCVCGNPFRSIRNTKTNEVYTAEVMYNQSCQINGEPICRSCLEQRKAGV